MLSEPAVSNQTVYNEKDRSDSYSLQCDAGDAALPRDVAHRLLRRPAGISGYLAANQYGQYDQAAALYKTQEDGLFRFEKKMAD